MDVVQVAVKAILCATSLAVYVKIKGVLAQMNVMTANIVTLSILSVELGAIETQVATRGLAV